VQQGYARTLVPVTKQSIIQLERNIVQILGWRLDPPTVTSAMRIILQRLMILMKTTGQFVRNAADVQRATDRYVWEIMKTKATYHFPTVKLARGAVALSMASAKLLPREGRASIVPESAQHTWNQICTLAFASETFLEDMVELGCFLDTGRQTATSSSQGN